jgi:putative methionine-R-sulfoxide reductase with GAF domain
MANTKSTTRQSTEIEALYRKRAIYLSLMLTAATIFVVINSVLSLEPGATVSATIQLLGFGIPVSLASAYLAYRGRVTTSVIVLILMLFTVIGYTLTQTAGLGTYLVIFSAVTSLGIASQTLPAEKFRTANYLIAALAVGLILFDLFYPASRPVSFLTLSLPIIITMVIMVIVGGLVAREFPRYPLQTKMSLTFLVVAAVPLMALAAFNNYTTRQTLTNNAGESLLAGATQTAAQIDAFISSELAAVRAEARLLSLGDEDISNDSTQLTFADRSRISTFLRGFSSREPFLIQSYGFLDLNGIVFADTVLPNVGHDESQWDYFQEALANPQPYVSSVQFLRNDAGRLNGYIHFSHVVYNRHGEAVGVVRARYNAAVLQQIVAESGEAVGESAYMALYDRHGFTLAHSQDEARRYQFLASPNPNIYSQMRAAGQIPSEFPLTRYTESNSELAQKLAEVDETPIFETVDAAIGTQANLAARVANRNQPLWQIVAIQPQSALLPPILAQTRSTTLLSLILAGLAVGMGLLVSQALVRPLINLRQTADQITAGDLAARATITSQDEFGVLGGAFNNMAGQLQQVLTSLEMRVLERTRALEVASQVSRSLSTILDPNQLVKTVVEQVRTSFDYYHAHIYLLDEKGGTLRMVGGTGQAGQAMLEQGHKISFGKGLVGRAAATNSAVLIPNVTQDPDWLPNPLLPNTRAEIAVPISLGDDVLGVLDVQHNIVDGLSDQDARLLQAVANQVAIALQNARIYQKAQDRARRQELINQIGHKIQTTDNMEEAMQIAVRELGQAVNAPHTRARLHHIQPSNGNNSET